jgi:carbon-monoxide dehydrogenase medium subunit
MAPELVEPTTVEEACSALSSDPEGARLIAGGTAVVVMLQQGLIAPSRIVSMDRLRELEGISATAGGLRIGARETLTDVARSSELRASAPALAGACGHVGNVRVRNAATLGGNVAEADYASDPPTVLACLGATCTVQASSGRRSLPVRDLITDFYTTTLERDEIITEVVVPAREPGERSIYLRYLSRSSEDRPCVGVAARARFDPGGSVDALDVAVGAVAGTPRMHPDVTQTALGQRLDDRVIDEVADGFADVVDPLDDVRGSSWYRRKVIAVLVRRALRGLQMADG